MADVIKDVCSSKWTGDASVSVAKMKSFAKAWAAARLRHALLFLSATLSAMTCTQINAHDVILQQCPEIHGSKGREFP